jgi:hypothetical protein
VWADSRLPLELVIGDEDPVLGAKVIVHVSGAFGRSETKQLHSALQSKRFRDLLVPYVCGDPLPEFSFTVSLWREAPFHVRHLEIQEQPKVDKRPENACFLAALEWFAIEEVKAIEKAKQRDVAASTDRVEAAVSGCVGVFQGPTCDCSRRSSGTAAITWHGCEQ